MSPTTALILWTALAALSWALWGWLVAWLIYRQRGLERLPIWPIAGGAVCGGAFAFLYGVPPFLLQG